jgi:sulfur-oxidizing protein SoxX
VTARTGAYENRGVTSALAEVTPPAPAEKRPLVDMRNSMRRGVVALAFGVALTVVTPSWAQPRSKALDRPLSLTGVPGDVDRGRALVWARDRGNCVACHIIPAPDMVTHGDVGPPLKGIATRQTEGQIRARVIDARAFNAASVMPSYHRTEGLRRVAKALEGGPVLSPQDIEDVVAFMLTLREGKP